MATASNNVLKLGGECPTCERQLLVITQLPDGLSVPAANIASVEVRCDECQENFFLEEVDAPEATVQEALFRQRNTKESR